MSGASSLDRRLRPLWNRLADLSRDLAEHGYDIAVEGDRWFVAALHGLDRGMNRAGSGVAEAGQQVVARSRRWLPRFGRDIPPRERIRRAIAREAKRRGIEGEQLECFSQNIGLVVELVLSGEVSVEDIAFEHAPRDEPVPDTEPCPASEEPVSGTPPGSDRLQEAR